MFKTDKNEGLSQHEVQEKQALAGKNILFQSKKPSLWKQIFSMVSEPMVLILVLAAALYFGLNQVQEGFTLLVALGIVVSVSLYQERRSAIALDQLRNLSQPRISAFRDGNWIEIQAEEICRDDILQVEEGQTIPADALVLESHDFAVNEAILTGEPSANPKWKDDKVLAGSQISSGSAQLLVLEIGAQTELGKLGRSLSEVEPGESPLQLEINRFVKKMGWAGVFAFSLVWLIQLAQTASLAQSLLLALTMAMALVPEEIPVAFSSFMALGAMKMAKNGVLAKNARTIESLGSATVICFDKTGTITTDSMEVWKAIPALVQEGEKESVGKLELLRTAWLACEKKPFDSMEMAIFKAWQDEKKEDSTQYEVVCEYPLAGKPPMMTHIHQAKNGAFQVCGKGALEKILSVCHLEKSKLAAWIEKGQHLANQGFRVLGVARADFKGQNFPSQQEDFGWQFLGIIVLENPPKENARQLIKTFSDCGIQTKMITGDQVSTGISIATQIGMTNPEAFISGQEVMNLCNAELQKKVSNITVFARMFPEAKMRVIKALQNAGEIVAMTGDGVNDGPALKAAHIGISMGKKGTDIARQAASLVLINDDLNAIRHAIEIGRTIYENLKKAIAYIVSIHIPIVFLVAIPLIFNWKWAQVLFPVHVVFLELVMGPTCSFAFENEPPEANVLNRPPVKRKMVFFSARELALSLVQGLMISISLFSVLFFAKSQSADSSTLRTIVFTSLVCSNIFLCLSNRSFEKTVLQTITIKNWLLWFLLTLTLILLFSTHLIPFVRDWFGFSPVSFFQLVVCLAFSLLGTWWIEVWKYLKFSKT
jgi:Ca2+-transporting ATPase